MVGGGGKKITVIHFKERKYPGRNAQEGRKWNSVTGHRNWVPGLRYFPANCYILGLGVCGLWTKGQVVKHLKAKSKRKKKRHYERGR